MIWPNDIGFKPGSKLTATNVATTTENVLIASGTLMLATYATTNGSQVFYTSGEYISIPLVTSKITRLRISYITTTPTGTTVTVSFRAHDGSAWGSWTTVANGTTYTVDTTQIQYKVALATTDNKTTPSISKFFISGRYAPTFTSTAGKPPRGAYLQEIRDAINGLCGHYGMIAPDWIRLNGYSKVIKDDDYIQVASIINSMHVSEGLGSWTPTVTPVPGQVIRDDTITELQTILTTISETAPKAPVVTTQPTLTFPTDIKAPSFITAAMDNINDTTVTVSWGGCSRGTPSMTMAWNKSDSTDVVRYEMWVSTDSGSTWTIVSAIDSSIILPKANHSVTNTWAYTSSIVKVIAIDQNGNSTEVVLNTPIVPNTDGDVNHYELHYSTNNKETWAVVDSNISASATSYTHTIGTYGDYWYRIKAVTNNLFPGNYYYYDRYTKSPIYPKTYTWASEGGWKWYNWSSGTEGKTLYSGFSMDQYAGTFTLSGSVVTMADIQYGAVGYFIGYDNLVHKIEYYSTRQFFKRVTSLSINYGGTPTYVRGNLLESNLTAIDGTYPDDGVYATDGYWYTKKSTTGDAKYATPWAVTSAGSHYCGYCTNCSHHGHSSGCGNCSNCSHACYMGSEHCSNNTSCVW